MVRAIDGKLVAEPMQWGLIPGWWNKDELPTRTINTRADEAPEKPMWRAAVKNSRALVPAMGYYEWQGAKPPKQPYYIHLPGNELMCFAGLWSEWRPRGASGGDDVDSRLTALLDRVKEDDEARQQFVDLLELLGPDDPRTASYRRQLTARLY